MAQVPHTLPHRSRPVVGAGTGRQSPPGARRRSVRWRALLAAMATLVAVLASVGSSSPASAAQGDLQVFTDTDNIIGPRGITIGPDQNAWFTIAVTNKIGRVTPLGATTFFDPATSPGADVVHPFGITTGPDGNLWFTSNGNDKIGRMTPEGEFTTFGAPAGHQIDNPNEIVTGPDGNLWFSNALGVGRIDPDTGIMDNFSTVSSGPAIPGGSWDVTPGPDANVWFVSLFDNVVGRVTPAGVITTFRPPASLGTPTGISAGADGNLWITTASHGAIGRVTTAGAFTAVYTPTAGQTHVDGDLALNPADQSLWWTSSNNSLGRITTGGQVTSFPASNQVDGPIDLAVDAGNRAWFVSVNNRRVGFMETGGGTGPTLPGAPRSVAATQTGESGSVRVSYRPPADNGGDAITSYKAICSAAGHTTRSALGGVTLTTAAPPIVVSGMDNGVQYGCRVQARNGVPGHGPNSGFFFLTVGAPRPPGSITATTPGAGKVKVTWPPALSFSGAPVLRYEVDCLPADGDDVGGLANFDLAASARSQVFRGVPAGHAFTCSVRATNRFGDSAERFAPAPVTTI